MLAVKTAVGPTIMLQSGAYFDLLDPHGSTFTIEDIAHGLSHVCRFAGQSKRFYSVAEHSFHVSTLVAREHALSALMHDAAEAFIGDVTRPLKQLLPEYKAIERNVEAAIAERFGLSVPMDPSVKAADLAMLACEQGQLMPPHADEWSSIAGIRPPQVAILCWSPEVARDAFLGRYRTLVS